MAIAFLTLRFDPRLDQMVRDVWVLLHGRGIKEAGPPRHRPHITLAAYEVDDVEFLCTALDRVAPSLEAVSIRFSSIGVFPEAGTVFLSPHMSAALSSLHREMLRSIQPVHGTTLYPEHLLPDVWAPHCTLANRLSPDDVARAVRICQEHWHGMEGRAEAVGVLVLPAKDDHCEARLGTVRQS